MRLLRNDLPKQLSTGFSSALMTCTGGAILIMQTAIHFDLSHKQLIAWFFICYAIAGLFNLFLTLYFKVPVAGAHSITTAAFLSTTAFTLDVNALVGTYLLAGLFIFLLGISGLFGKLFHYIPRPVIEAMLAGIVLQFIIKIIPIFKDYTVVAILALVGYLLSLLKFKSIPPMIFVIVFACIGLFFTTTFSEVTPMPFSLPTFIMPEFSWQGAISLALPIAILVLSNDLAVSMAALTQQHYKVKLNQFIAFSGLASVLGSVFGAHSINAGGMMTTLCSSEESGMHRFRYRAALTSSILCIIFGIFAWLIVPYLLLLPSYFITLIVGFSLLGICINALKQSFSHGEYRYSVAFAFIISFANISFFNVSSALWSLILGTLLALLFKEGIYNKKEIEQHETSKTKTSNS